MPTLPQPATYSLETPILAHPCRSRVAPCSLLIDEVEAIWSRVDEADDWSALHAKVAAVRCMGEALRGAA